jgi:large repetitive protein
MLTHNRRRSVVFSLAALAGTVASLAAAFAAAGSPTRAQAVACGDTITQSVKLAADLTCTSQYALVVGADNIAIDLGGHTITGRGENFGQFGIYDNGHGGLTVENGTIVGFGEGIYVLSAPGSSVTGVTARLNTGGIVLGFADDRATVTKDTVVADTGGTLGIGVAGSDSRVTKNTVSASSDFGIRMVGDDGVISGNTVWSSWSGIAVGGAGNEVSKNLVEGSRGGDGIDLSGAQTGIVSGNTVTGNEASGIRVSDGSDGNTISKNTANGNTGTGIFITADSDGSLVTGNTANGNYSDGIDSDNASATTRIGKNIANVNRIRGIEAAAGVTDLGGNKARGNGTEDCSAGVITCG